MVALRKSGRGPEKHAPGGLMAWSQFLAGPHGLDDASTCIRRRMRVTFREATSQKHCRFVNYGDGRGLYFSGAISTQCLRTSDADRATHHVTVIVTFNEFLVEPAIFMRMKSILGTRNEIEYYTSGLALVRPLVRPFIRRPSKSSSLARLAKLLFLPGTLLPLRPRGCSLASPWPPSS